MRFPRIRPSDKIHVKEIIRKYSQEGKTEGEVEVSRKEGDHTGCHDTKSGHTGLLWRQCGSSSELSHQEQGPQSVGPLPLLPLPVRCPFPVLPAFMFTGETASGNLRATADKELQRSCRELMCTQMVTVPWAMSGAWVLLATPPACAGGSQVSRPAQPGSLTNIRSECLTARLPSSLPGCPTGFSHW